MMRRPLLFLAAASVASAAAGCEVVFGFKHADLWLPDAGSGASTASSSGTSSSGSSSTGSSSSGTSSTTETSTADGGEVWGEGFPDSVGAGLQPSPTGIAVDVNGNTVVTGSYVGTLTLDADAGASFTSQGAASYFLVSFDASGHYRWGASFNAIGNQGVSVHASVAVDGNGNVLWAADLSRPSVKVGTTTYTNPSTTSDSVLVASFSPTGAVQWAAIYGGASTTAFPTAVGADSTGSMVVTGAFSGPLTFGAQPTLTSTSQNMFLVKLNSQNMGTPSWANSYGDVIGQSPGVQTPLGMALDSADSIYVTGSFDVSAQFGTTPLYSVGSTDIFLAKFNSSGGPAVWSASHGGPQNDYGTAVALDPGGAVLLTGWLGGTANLGGGNLTVPAMNTRGDGFVARYDATAADTYQWSIVFGGAAGITPGSCGIASDKNGEAIVAGTTLGPVDFGAGTMTPPGTNPNVYLAKLDTGGKPLWSKLLGDTNGQQSGVVAIDPTTQEVVLAFGNNGTVDLGTTTVTSGSTQSSLVVARFHP